MKKLLLSICLSGLLASIFSCNPNNNNNPNPIASDSLSGVFISTHVKSDSVLINTGFADNEEAICFFFAIPGDTASITLVDSVAVNNFPLEVVPDQNGVNTAYYAVDSFSNLMNMTSTCNWHVYGSNGIPSFTYNFPVPYPSFTSVLPDTITKTAGITFHITAINADSLVIGIAGDSLGGYIYKAFAPSSTSQSFTATEINSLVPSSSFGIKSLMQIFVYKSTKQTFNGKNFSFTKVYDYYNPVWIQ